MALYISIDSEVTHLCICVFEWRDKGIFFHTLIISKRMVSDMLEIIQGSKNTNPSLLLSNTISNWSMPIQLNYRFSLPYYQGILCQLVLHQSSFALVVHLHTQTWGILRSPIFIFLSNLQYHLYTMDICLMRIVILWSLLLQTRSLYQATQILKVKMII